MVLDLKDLEAQNKSLDHVAREWAKLLDERDARIQELEAETDTETEPVCKYKTCPEEQREAELRVPLREKVLTWAAGIAQGFTAGAVIWLLYQQWVIWKSTAESIVQ